MSAVTRRFALGVVAAVAAAASLCASAQVAELNPTVKVLARPQSPVPADCATDTNPASAQPALPSVAIGSEPQPGAAVVSVPPSNDLRTRMRSLQAAVEGDDYAAFKAAFEDARRAVAAHPPGGERNAANDALHVFTDIGRVWDYAMASPTGSFFDATVQGGSLLAALKRYPDYGRSVADETITAGDKTLYPTRESRRFLARESARRLAHMGVSVSPKVAQGARPEPPPRRTTAAPPAVKPPTVATKTPAKTPGKSRSTPKTTQAGGTTKPQKTGQKPPEKTASTTPAKPPHVEPTPVPKAQPATPQPAKVAAVSTMPPMPPVVTTTTAAPPPVPTTTTTTAVASATSPPTTTTTTTATATTTTTATASDTTASAATTSSTETATAAAETAATGTTAPAEKQNGNMNLIWAVVLILVGIGVLVVLFRASD
jgi:hypothetical protein